MTKRIILGTIMSFGLVGSAAADDKADAQKKVDAAKTDTCEKTKKFLADQSAKGRCKDESAAAQKITCSASTFKEMTDLNTKCAKAPAAKDDKPAPADAKPKCRAMIDGKAVAEIEETSAVKCTTLLTAEVKKTQCTADNKGKKLEFTINRDHKIGKDVMKDSKGNVTCAK